MPGLRRVFLAITQHPDAQDYHGPHLASQEDTLEKHTCRHSGCRHTSSVEDHIVGHTAVRTDPEKGLLASLSPRWSSGTRWWNPLWTVIGITLALKPHVPQEQFLWQLHRQETCPWEVTALGESLSMTSHQIIIFMAFPLQLQFPYSRPFWHKQVA